MTFIEALYSSISGGIGDLTAQILLLVSALVVVAVGIFFVPIAFRWVKKAFKGRM